MKNELQEKRGRPRSFDEQSVIEACLPLFLEHGYFGVSVKDIIEFTNLEKSSFYLAYSSKELFYCKILEFYHCNAFNKMSEILNGTDDCIKAFETLIDFLYEVYSVNDDFGFGCLAVNSMTIAHSELPNLYKTLLELREKLTSLFEVRLRLGQEANQISSRLNANHLARILHSLFDSILLMARSDKNNAANMDVMFMFIRKTLLGWSLESQN